MPHERASFMRSSSESLRRMTYEEILALWNRDVRCCVTDSPDNAPRLFLHPYPFPDWMRSLSRTAEEPSTLLVQRHGQKGNRTYELQSILLGEEQRGINGFYVIEWTPEPR